MVNFIIPSFIIEFKHIILLKKCLNSITEHSNYKNIYVIINCIEKYQESINELIKHYKNCYLVASKYSGSEDQQVFKLILDLNHDENELFFIIQDSMFINDKLKNIEQVENIKFLWHFTIHRIHWNIIREPETKFNIDNKILNHTDLIKFHLKNDYNKDEKFLEYGLNCLDDMNKWCGCFGNCCIIKKRTVKYLNDKTNFANIFLNYSSNRDRRVNESIFALLCHYYLPDNYSNSYDGLYYDGYTTNNYNGIKFILDDTEFEYCARKNYISKISFNR